MRFGQRELRRFEINELNRELGAGAEPLGVGDHHTHGVRAQLHRQRRLERTLSIRCESQSRAVSDANIDRRRRYVPVGIGHHASDDKLG